MRTLVIALCLAGCATSQTTRVSVEPIPDALMAVPADYKLVKRN